MQRSTKPALRIGDWRVDPVSGEIVRNGEPVRVEVRTMRLLECLAEHAGETVSIDELLNRVWPDVTVSPDSVYQAIATLRRTLGDDPKKPIYIATVPRLGYRMVATVSPWADTAEQAFSAPALPAATPRFDLPGRRSRRRFHLLWALAAIILMLLAAAFFLREQIPVLRRRSAAAPPAQAQRSVAVLPFLDLTEGMKNEEFADGMTEELIDKLSRVPGLHVPSATASFFFKNKQVTPADIARNLGVAYVLDGSVRKSGQRLRIAARLMRADSGYVTWSETYDRPVDDLLMVQDDIASDVTRALTQSLEGPQ